MTEKPQFVGTFILEFLDEKQSKRDALLDLYIQTYLFTYNNKALHNI